MKIFDTHAHFNDTRFKTDLYEVLNKCRDNNIKKIVNISANLSDSLTLKEFTINLNKTNNMDFYYTIGIHPDEIENTDITFSNQDIDLDLQQLNNYNLLNKIYQIVINSKNDKEFVAIGEIGLDYYGDNKQNDDIKYLQKLVFIKQIIFAQEFDLPIVIHSRNAVDDTYSILKKYIKETKGVLHCYSYNQDYLSKFLELGLYIGIGGVLTFKNGVKLKEVAKICPLDRIVLETDSPYLSPTPHRGERNDSSNLKYVLEELSKIKNIDIEELANICWYNSLKLYNLED